jgi:hypothetical protein
MVEVAVITKALADLTPKIGGVVVLAIHNCAERLSFWITGCAWLRDVARQRFSRPF